MPTNSRHSLLAPHTPTKPVTRHHESDKQALRILLTWQAPERIWKPKNQVWYLSSAAIILLAMLLFAKLGYWIAIIALLAFLVLWFIQGTLPPWIVEHKITSKGLFAHNIFWRWADIEYFWFATKGDVTLLQIDFQHELRQPRLTLILNNTHTQKEIFEIMIKHTKYAKPAEAGYNFIARPIYGQYVPISNFIKDLDRQDEQED